MGECSLRLVLGIRRDQLGTNVHIHPEVMLLWVRENPLDSFRDIQLHCLQRFCFPWTEFSEKPAIMYVTCMWYLSSK